MKPKLVIGVGNPLMGDEGIGYQVVSLLLEDPRLPQDTEVMWGGTDLLRCADSMEGRQRVIVVDAMLDDLEPGAISVLDYGSLEPQRHDESKNRLDCGVPQKHAHHLSATEAIELARLGSEALRATSVTVIAVTIDSASASPNLSRSMNAKVAQVVDSVLEQLAESKSAASG